MKSDPDPLPPDSPEFIERRTRRYTKGAIIFGVAMATIEMTVLLYVMYC